MRVYVRGRPLIGHGVRQISPREKCDLMTEGKGIGHVCFVLPGEITVRCAHAVRAAQKYSIRYMISSILRYTFFNTLFQDIRGVVFNTT